MSGDVNNTEVFKAALFPESSIGIVDFTLAGKIGLAEAIVLQRIFFWTKHNKAKKINADYKDGYWWMYNSLTDFEQDIKGAIKRTTIHDAIETLAKWGVVVVANYNHSALDKTVWYRVDEDELNVLWKAVQDKDFNKQEYKGKNYSKEQLKEMKKRKLPLEPQNNWMQDSESEYRCSKSEYPIAGIRISDVRNPNDNTIDKPKTTKDELTKTVGIQKEKDNEDINYKSLMSRLWNLSKDEYTVDVVMYFYKRYEECFGKQHGKITNEKLLLIFDKLKHVIDNYYEKQYDSFMRFLMDKYINDSYFQEHHLYDFAFNLDDIYQRYNSLLWIDHDKVLAGYANNPYIKKKGA